MSVPSVQSQSPSRPLLSRRTAYKRRLVYGASSALALLLSWSAPSCTTNEGDVNNYYSLGGAPSSGGSEGTGGDGYKSYLPACINLVDFEDLEIDLFGEDGHRFYFEISPEARVAGDEQRCNFGHDVHGSVYTLGEDDDDSCPIPAINVRVLPAGSKSCADTGKVELDLPGQSSFRTWSEIPNIKLDIGEFQELVFPSGDRQVRMNNGQADSTIVREAVALRIWAALDYPAPKTRFVQTQSNIWDTEVRPGVTASHVMVQSYKASFFTQTVPSVRHVWEGAGDPFAGDCGPWGCGGDWGGDIFFDEGAGQDAFPPQRGGFSGDCQWSVDEDCDEESLSMIIETVSAVPQGPGFMEATADYIDWPMLHKNQCLAALTGTGDDWIHNSNNVVIALLDTGKIIYLPYSVDISGGHPWYQQTPYDGYAFLTMGCQQDPDCRQLALDTCEEMIDEFEALDVPTSIVDERCDALKDAGLDRKPDAAVCASLRTFYEDRPGELRDEIEYLRAGGGGGWGGQMVGDGDFDGGLK